MTALCTICARGGSKGVKGKNVRLLNGLPLIAHSIAQARASGTFDAIAVSSDSDEILSIAREHGADFLIVRPGELASDTAAKLPVIRHCVEQAEVMLGRRTDVCVDLDATSPLRHAEDIVAVVAMLDDAAATNVITAMPARRSPYFNMVECGADKVPRLAKALEVPVVRRQDAPACFDMNASIYCWRRDALMQDPTLFTDGTRLYVMPEERSIDIDSEIDFALVELLMARAIAENGGGA
ncbi:flagellar modification protein B [Sphingomonas sp. Leaf412]|uniref:acylneuraminate cytidylyltransferase family protein n=1 Tax=Sphingomonas sp. Leaf412 TaxID=1736370 RepID=UPI000702300B|nr:acylneuraminate cytidylyltransferase family protein [Sphingomonas sp. Leaf412]KQT31157.1 flagellar modification protein B [Sphingomonas sp. Leaf412]